MGGAALIYYQSEKKRLQTQTVTGKVTSVGKPLLGGPWTLVDCATGTCVTDASFHGKPILLYFGFTHCPDICPNELVRLGDVLDSLPPALQKELVPLFITVDPARDTVAQMNAYQKDFHPKLRMLCGTPDQIKDVTKAYRVYFSKADEMEDEDKDDELEDEDYLVDHSIVMYLVGPTGEFLDFFTQSARVEDIVKKIQSALLTSSSSSSSS